MELMEYKLKKRKSGIISRLSLLVFKLHHTISAINLSTATPITPAYPS